jgi:hypothetical protein
MCQMMVHPMMVDAPAKDPAGVGVGEKPRLVHKFM